MSNDFQEVVYSCDHPTRDMPRSETTDLQRQNINIATDYGQTIDQYLRLLEG